jgi:hypothetical protein
MYYIGVSFSVQWSSGKRNVYFNIYNFFLVLEAVVVKKERKIYKVSEDHKKK